MSETDALTDVLKTIRLTGSTYFCSGFNKPWGMALDGRDKGAFHVVVSGACWLIQETEIEPLALQTGDIVAFPAGGAHRIVHSPNSQGEPLPGKIAVEQIVAGNNPFWDDESNEPSTITLLCGTFHYDSSVDHPFVKDLPCFIHVKAAETPDLDWLRSIVNVMARESNNPSPGSLAMIDRLTEALFIQLMRVHMQAQTHATDYLSALADAQIGAALNRIHTEEDSVWTVEALAEASSMARTAFTDKFTKMVGIAPKVYLTRTRMNRAKNRLIAGRDTMSQIAQDTGYASEASFSKAFKQFFNLSPGKFKKRSKP